MMPLRSLRKISVVLEDRVYMQLIDYSAAKSKRVGCRFSVSASASELISKALREPPPHEEQAIGER
jgi:hypothetical protein